MPTEKQVAEIERQLRSDFREVYAGVDTTEDSAEALAEARKDAYHAADHPREREQYMTTERAERVITDFYVDQP